MKLNGRLLSMKHFGLIMGFISILGAPVSGVDNEENTQSEGKPLGQLSRIIIGFEQSAACAAEPVQDYFINLYTSVPLAPAGGRTRLWGDVRVASVPQQVEAPIREFLQEFPSQVAEVKVNEIARSVEFLAGLEFRLPSMTEQRRSFAQDVDQRFSWYFVVGGGASTPLSPKESIKVFQVTPQAVEKYPQAQNKQYVAFTTPDRDRFFRQYYVGLRFKTSYFSDDGTPLRRFPATLDVTFGQNEAVTGGKLRGGLIRLDGFFPLPWHKGKFIFFYGSAWLNPTGAKDSAPLILQRAPDGTPVPAPNVAIMTSESTYRDFYRIGFGFDIFSIVDLIKGSGPAG